MTSPRDGRDDLAQVDAMFRRAGASTNGGPDPWARRVDPEVTRRRRRGAGITVAVVLVVLLAVAGGYVALALNAPLAAAVPVVDTPAVTVPAAASVTMPSTGQAALSVSGADQYLGSGASGILSASGGDAPAPIASISKLITAMVVLDHKPLGASSTGPTLTFSKTDHALYDKYYVLGATIAEMPTGSTMTEHDAIETMLVVSACNYAEAVSTWAFGSQAAFLTATKRWLTAHGLTHTTMVEPTGLDARNRSTPSDLIALGKLAMADSAIAGIVAQKNLDVPGLPNQSNTNDLLGTDRVNGIKTGTLEDYGSNLLFSASVPVGTDTPLTVIGVVLGGGSRGEVDGDVDAMIQSLTAGFHPVTVAKADQKVGRVTTAWGSTATAVLESETSLFTWSNTPVTTTMTSPVLKTGKDGEQIASVTFTAGTATATVPVVLQGSIRPPSEWWRLTHPRQVLGWG